MKEACSPEYSSIMAEKQQLLEREQIQQKPYKPLGLDDDLVVDLSANDKPGKCAWKVVVVPMALFLLIVHAAESGWFAQLLALFLRDSFGTCVGSSVAANATRHNHHHHHPHHHHRVLNDVRQSWGQYSPYFNSTSEISSEVPHGCETSFVQVLARHGSRFPTSHKSAKYAKMIGELVPLIPETALTGPYSFLKNYTYELGGDVLTTLGQLEMADLGVELYTKYHSLLKDESTAQPFVRASGSARVIDSAEIFSRALVAARLDDSSASSSPWAPALPILVLPENSETNNTLDRNGCPALHADPYTSIANHAMKTFADRFVLSITDRLNADLQLHGENKLDIQRTVYLMDICAFETVALIHPYPPSSRTADGTGISPFCDIFTDDDFITYDYHASLGKFYGFSYGNPLAPNTGVGFVNELVARLTGRPVDDQTSTNHTLDAAQKTFPIGKQSDGRFARVFADFSHDNTIASIHAALGLYANADLPTDRIVDEESDEADGFSAAATVPFGDRTVIEKLKCKDNEQELIRIIVNGRVASLKSCGGDKRGMCKLDRFIDSLQWARDGGDWAKCYD